VKIAAVLFLLLAACSTCYAIRKTGATRWQSLERVAVYATAEFDAAATCRAIRSCPPGYVCPESNPMLRPLAGRMCRVAAT